jgi:hypothetical protein
MTLRGRLVALGVVVAVVFAVGITELLRTRTPDCTIAAPRPSLAPALRALGDFDQGYDAGDAAALEDAATRAASALHSDMVGATAEAPVMVTAARPGSQNALVVPLRAAVATTQGTPPLAGLAVFLLDCQSEAYFAEVEDDATTQPALAAFPPVGRPQAAAALGSTGIRLEYTASPLRPRWVTIGTPARSVAAR